MFEGNLRLHPALNDSKSERRGLLFGPKKGERNDRSMKRDKTERLYLKRGYTRDLKRGDIPEI
jgi:hypothetical protein